MPNPRIIFFSYLPLYFPTIRFQIPYNQKVKTIEMRNDHISCIKRPWPKAHKLVPKHTSIVSMEP
jgi:hypothetical protein